MTASDQGARPARRAGTLTLGVVLVAAGTAMLVSLFWPALEAERLLKASPLILILLGVEVLFAARGGGKVKYDWVGMLLCVVLVGAGMVFYAAARAYESGAYTQVYDCSRWADETGFRMEYEYFNGFDSHTLYLEKGDLLRTQASARSGALEAEVSGEDGETLFEAATLNGERSFRVPRSGDYTILVHGRGAAGGFAFERIPAAEEDLEAPAEPEAPEAPELPPEEDP